MFGARARGTRGLPPGNLSLTHSLTHSPLGDVQSRGISSRCSREVVFRQEHSRAEVDGTQEGVGAAGKAFTII